MSRDDYQARILRVLLRIENDLDHPWTLDELAGIASFSKYHFHRLFTALVGETVASYLRRIRLEWAAGQVADTQRSIAEIGREAGYVNPEVFTRAFVRRFELTPSQFREVARDSGAAAAARSGSAAERVAARWCAATPDRNDAEAAPVETVHMPAIRCAFVRATGDYARSGPEAWGRLAAWARSRSIPVSARKRFSVGHDDPEVTTGERLRLDACVEILEGEAEERPGYVGVSDISGGEYARLEHTGSIDRISDSFARIYGLWLPESGREPAPWPPLIEHIDAAFPLGPPTATAVLLPLRSLDEPSSNPM